VDNNYTNEINLLDAKFEKVRKAVIEQHNKIDPIEKELLSNREDFHGMELKIKLQNRHIKDLDETIKSLQSVNRLILDTLNKILINEEGKQKKTLAFFLKACYTKLVNLFK